MEDKYKNILMDLHGYIGAIFSICEEVECFDDIKEMHAYLKEKFESLDELSMTVNKTKQEHQKELKGKIKAHVDEYKEKKKPTPPAKP